MADYFDAAKAQNDQARAALIESIRTQGSQARQAYEATQQQMQAQQRQAVSAALSQAQQRGAGADVTGLVSQQVAAPYDRGLSDLSASQASRQASLGQLQTSAGNFYDQANAALPALRSQQAQAQSTAQGSLQQRLAELQDAAQSRHDTQALSLSNLQEQIAARQATSATAAAKAQTAAAKPPTTAQTLSALGGATAFKNSVANANAELVPAYQADFAGQRGGAGPGSAPMATDDVARMYAEAMGQNAGLPAGVGSAIAGPAQKPATAANKISANGKLSYDAAKTVGMDKAAVDKIKGLKSKVVGVGETDAGTTTSPYQELVDDIRKARSGGVTLEQWNDRISGLLTERFGHDFPELRRLITAMYTG